jgi:hypothetical protein
MGELNSPLPSPLSLELEEDLCEQEWRELIELGRADGRADWGEDLAIGLQRGWPEPWLIEVEPLLDPGIESQSRGFGEESALLGDEQLGEQFLGGFLIPPVLDDTLIAD